MLKNKVENVNIKDRVEIRNNIVVKNGFSIKGYGYVIKI